MPREYAQLLIRLLILTGICLVVYWLGASLGGVLFPVFASLILAYLMDPLVRRLDGLGLGRTGGVSVVLLFILALILLAVTFLIPIVRAQVMLLAERMPTMVSSLQVNVIPWLQEMGVAIPENVTTALELYGDNLKSALPGLLNKFGSWLPGAITTTGAIVSSLLNIVLIPLFTFYFARDLDAIFAFFNSLIPESNRSYISSRLNQIDEIVGHWFRGQLQVAGILAVLYAVGFGLVFYFAGMKASTGIAVGILTGCLSLIPYVGAITGCVISVLLALIDWHGFGPLGGVAIVFGVVQVLEGYVLTPRIVGEKLGLSPATVMIALLAAGTLGGLVGMLFALPITGAMKVLGGDLIDYYRNSKWFRGETETDSTSNSQTSQTRKTRNNLQNKGSRRRKP
ncbi:MAG: AI-2E family transporter [Spirochaetia bacterium]|nr:AI-2E family transporter [Spirochaetia bacterium]